MIETHKNSNWMWGWRLLAGPLVWSVYFTVSYLVVEAACQRSFWQFRIAGVNALVVVVLGLTLFAWLLTLYITWQAYREWVNMRPENLRTKQEEFQPLAALFLNGLFSFVTLLIGLPVLFLQPCRWI